VFLPSESDGIVFVSESAATLEAESGYTMESSEVSDFRQCILDGAWASAEAALLRDHVMQEAKFLISQQKYLELLEASKTGAALNVLRHELAPLSVEPDLLHSLSRWVVCQICRCAKLTFLLSR